MDPGTLPSSAGSDYGSDIEEPEVDDTSEVRFFLDVREKGNRFGLVKVKKTSEKSETFQAISNFIINITGEVRAGVIISPMHA